MGNTISSSSDYTEYKNKIDALERRVLELEQKVFIGYVNVDGRLVQESEITKLLPTPIPKKRK